ncbi:type II secretion system protein [Desulfolutivibrio sp.]|uniref:type II secretion system protein n=1 Tax=Desulfolutivibrio sp. TaxID=2773296 RepID=UPI002F96C034
MTILNIHRPRGFSLIEIIITLVVLGLAGAMLATFMGPGITRSSDPLRALQNDASLQAVMENMIAAQEKTYPADLSGFSTSLGAVGATPTNTYGTYHVERNNECYLNGNVFTNGTGPYLCVTISAPGQSGSKISYLFTVAPTP